MSKNSYVIIPQPEPPKSRATILDMTGTVLKKMHWTEQQKEEMRLKNEDAANEPLTRLGRKSDYFYFQQERYEILDRTDKFMFVEIRKMGMNPDNSIPLVPDRKRELGSPYWDVRYIGVSQECIMNGLDEPTGYLTEPKEFIKPNFNIEIIVYDSKGWPTGETGYNADRERVEKRFHEVVDQYEVDQRRKAEQLKTAAENKRLGLVRTDKQARAKELRLQAQKDIRTSLEKINIDNALESSDVAEAVNRYIFYDTILKNL
jgi:hypothetical protein